MGLLNIKMMKPVHNITMISNRLYIYTDGSKMESGTAVAFTVNLDNTYIHDHSIRLRKNNSIYQAELIAIRCAVEWFTNTSYGTAYLYSDSQSSIYALDKTFPQNEIVLEIYKMMIENKLI